MAQKLAPAEKIAQIYLLLFESLIRNLCCVRSRSFLYHTHLMQPGTTIENGFQHFGKMSQYSDTKNYSQLLLLWYVEKLKIMNTLLIPLA